MITKEAIEAGLKAAIDKPLEEDDVRAILTAAFAAMRGPAVKVEYASRTTGGFYPSSALTPATDLQAENERLRAALERSLLIECYRSGQISEAAWQEHLADDPELRDLYGMDGIMEIAAALVSQIDADFTFDGQRDGAAEKLAAVKAIGDALSKAHATAWDDVRKYVEGLETEVERLKNELGDPDGVIAHAESITKLSEARIAELEKRLADAERVIEPFAEAAESLDGNERESSDIWENGAAMAITFGHLRAARAYMEGK